MSVLKEVSWCPTPDCPFTFIYDGNYSELKCPICKTHYCLKCKDNFNVGLKCEEFKQKVEKDQFIDKLSLF